MNKQSKQDGNEISGTAEKSPETADAFNRKLNNARKVQAILNTAAREFVENGYYQTSVAAIADKLNISKPTLYYYVGNKEAILFKCQLAALDQLKEELAGVLAENLNGMDTLQEFLRRLGKWIAGDFARCIARCHPDLLDVESQEKIQSGRGEMDKAVRDIICKGIEDGSIRKCNPQSVTAAFFGAFNWMAHWYDPERSTRSSKEISEDFITLFTHGLSPSEN